MDVITTHLNADFDAFASMVAAKKLYPDALVAFPGSQEKSLRDFFMESTLYILAIDRAKDIDLSKVKRLIVVDTRQKSRIGRFSALADEGGIEIHVYDHHPDSDEDIRGAVEVIRQVGATTTILSREIRDRELEISEEEATIMALGLYEDTGSFTYPSTTAEDLDAAAWLLSCGANLNIVSNMMTTDLNKVQIEVLHQLIEESELLNLAGLDVLVCTASVKGYVSDIAVLVQKYRDMENPGAILALVRMDSRVHLVARSVIPEVNAAEIAAEFGGGGHPSAASATIVGLSLYEAREKLVSLLEARITPLREAAQIMTRPVVTIRDDQTLREAAESLGRYQVNSLPVVRDGGVVGILHRQLLDNALRHGFEDQAVKGYMDPEVVAVGPHDSIDKVLQIALHGLRRLVPVLEGGHLIGVITRTDLLQHLRLPRAKDASRPEDFPSGRVRKKNIKRLMEEMLPEEALNLLIHAGEVAERREEDVYLVGGAVRDLLLRNPNLDLDLVVEGNGILFAKDFASIFRGSRVKGHEKFGTGVVTFADGFKIDVATARHEYYQHPGALPTVETSSIKRDLYRRDFTINTLAVSLNPGSFGQVLDFFGGARDVKERVIRVLHNLAFVEDPTRILRALRFSSRFGFTVARHTLGLMKAAIQLRMFERVEGKRLLNELIHALDEKNPVPGLSLMEEMGVFKALHPSLEFSARIRALVDGVIAVLAWWRYLFLGVKVEPWIIYFLAVTDGLSPDDFVDVVGRFSIPPNRAQTLGREREQLRAALAALARGEADKPSQLVRLLKPLSMEALLFMMARTSREETRRQISEYITKLRHVKPLLRGDDLIALGYPQGPIFHNILEALRAARLDARVVTKEDEIALVRELFVLDAGRPEDVYMLAKPPESG